MPKELEHAWAAGLLEGEGCFSIFQRKASKHRWCSMAIHCEMTDKDIIERLQSVFRVGSIRHRDNTKLRCDGLKRKDAWHWSVQNKEDILKVLKIIYPYLGTRRKTKADELIKYIETGEYNGSKSSLAYSRSRKNNLVLCESIQPASG